jgi:hypothetical protein
MRQRLRSPPDVRQRDLDPVPVPAVGRRHGPGGLLVSSNSQIGPRTISGHKPPTGKHANIIAGSINGQDIADRSGVDTCQTPLVAKYGPLCVGSDGGSTNWQEAEKYCTDLGLRVPSVSEAVALAKKHDVPGVASGNSFWTDAYYPTTFEGVSTVGSVIVSEDGFRLAQKDDGSRFGTVCVTDPSA